MNARLSAKLIRYSIENATDSAGAPRRKRGTSDIWLLCAVLVSVAAVVVAL